jgi:hypothetical protein
MQDLLQLESKNLALVSAVTTRNKSYIKKDNNIIKLLRKFKITEQIALKNLAPIEEQSYAKLDLESNKGDLNNNSNAAIDKASLD